MKKIGLTFITFIVLATFGVQAQGSDTVETWRCFALLDFDKNTVLVELTQVKGLLEDTAPEEAVEAMEKALEALLVELTQVKGLLEDMAPEEAVEAMEKALEALGLKIGQISVAGVTYFALFRITGFERRWDFGEEMKYAFIINPDGSGAYYDFSPVEEGETTKPSQLYDCVLSRSLSSAELPQWDGTQGQPRREKDLQKRPGRKRTADGWVYELE